MLAYTYIEKGCFELLDKPKPKLQSEYDAIVKGLYQVLRLAMRW